MVLSGIDTGI